MMSMFILENRVPVRCPRTEDWGRWMEAADRKVAFDQDNLNQVRVSTVFLGMDHSWGEGPPMLFETMIFGGEHDQYQTRCSTWEQAEDMHKVALGLLGWA